MSDTITVTGEYGTLTCDSVTGEVVEYEPSGWAEVSYAYIVRVDVDEWQTHYPGETLYNCDILDIGYWDKDGEYGPAEPGFRQDLADSDQEEK